MAKKPTVDEATKTVNADGFFSDGTEIIATLRSAGRVLAAEVERLRAEHTRALAKVDWLPLLSNRNSTDYREGHLRDNTTPDELRDIVLGLALKIGRLQTIDRLVKPTECITKPSPAGYRCVVEMHVSSMADATALRDALVGEEESDGR